MCLLGKLFTVLFLRPVDPRERDKRNTISKYPKFNRRFIFWVKETKKEGPHALQNLLLRALYLEIAQDLILLAINLV